MPVPPDRNSHEVVSQGLGKVTHDGSMDGIYAKKKGYIDGIDVTILIICYQKAAPWIGSKGYG